MDELATKEAVRRRDGYRCTKCGMTNAESRERYGRSLDVHRVTRGSAYSTEPGVCETRCIGCHAQEPRQFARPELDSYRRSIGQAIRAARTNANLSLSMLAGRLGITTSSLCRMETGKHWPSVVAVLKAADVMKVPICSLLDPGAALPPEQPKVGRPPKKPKGK